MGPDAKTDERSIAQIGCKAAFRIIGKCWWFIVGQKKIRKFIGDALRSAGLTR